MNSYYSPKNDFSLPQSGTQYNGKEADLGNREMRIQILAQLFNGYVTPGKILHCL